jgi:excisionase family DNA binding protein
VRLINTYQYLFILKTADMASSKFILPKNCEICGKQFNAKTIYSKYCSQKCSEAGARKKKSLQKQEEKRQQLTAQIPVDRPYITIAEAVLLFGISRDTIYRQIRKGNIPAVNLGERLTRISRAHIEAMFPRIETINAPETELINTKLNYNQDECYTIGEVTDKFGISASTVNNTIRKNGIPRKQVGKFVYVPKVEIDQIFLRK